MENVPRRRNGMHVQKFLTKIHGRVSSEGRLIYTSENSSSLGKSGLEWPSLKAGRYLRSHSNPER